MRKNIPLSLALFLVLALSVGCGTAGNPSAATTIDHTNYDPSGLGEARIAAASALDVYFEHASVGQNVVDGIDALASSTDLSSGHASWSDESTAISWFASNDGLVDNHRGNPGAEAKISTFQGDMTDALAAAVDVAMFKFCWIDAPEGETAATTLFDSVRRVMEALEAAYPSVAFVWWTMPIETEQTSYGYDIEARQSYNDKVRAYCGDQGKWLLDIADIEGHDETGEAATLDIGGTSYEALCPDYAADTGHLNSAGAQKLAKAYWRLLAEIASEK